MIMVRTSKRALLKKVNKNFLNLEVGNMEYKQLNIFSYLQSIEKCSTYEDYYCWDSDINEIHRKLVVISKNLDCR